MSGHQGSVVSAIGSIITTIITAIADILIFIVSAIVTVSLSYGHTPDLSGIHTGFVGSRDDLGLVCGHFVLPLLF